jgi:hypothetical protein
MLFRCLPLFVSLFRLALADANSTCYYPNGVANHGAPCNSDADVSVCCGPTFVCLSNGLCQVGPDTRQTHAYKFYRSGCTDPTFTSPSCPKICTGREYRARLGNVALTPTQQDTISMPDRGCRTAATISIAAQRTTTAVATRPTSSRSALGILSPRYLQDPPRQSPASPHLAVPANPSPSALVLAWVLAGCWSSVLQCCCSSVVDKGKKLPQCFERLLSLILPASPDTRRGAVPTRYTTNWQAMRKVSRTRWMVRPQWSLTLSQNREID